MVNVYEAVSANKRKSLFVLIGFVVFVTIAVYIISNAFAIYLGYELGGLGIVGIALIVSGLISFAGYWTSDKIVLLLSGGREDNRKQDFLFYTVAENLSLAAGIPKPKLYIIEDSATNAFATGRDPEHAAVVATRGLLDKLNRTELEGVIAHELSHVRNYDTRLMAVVALLVGMNEIIVGLVLWGWCLGRGRSREKERGNVGIFIILGIIFAILSPIV